MDNTSTRELIINESYKLFIRNSYEAVSISDISQKIGLTKGALYHHFANKEEIFKAVIDKYFKIKAFEGNLKISLEEYIKKIVEFAKEVIHQIISEEELKEETFIPVNHLSLYIDAFRHYPGFSRENMEFFSSETDKIKQVIQYAIKSGEIKKEVDATITSLNLFSISAGLVVNMFHHNSTSKAVELFESQLNEFYKLLKI